MEIEELKSRLDAIERENNELKATNMGLSGELELWKPSQRVEVAVPQDRRTAKEFVTPRANVRQFRLEEALAMSESDLMRAVSNHMQEQIPHLVGAPLSMVQNMKNLYCKGLVMAIKGQYKDARKTGFRDYSHCLNLQKFGFVPFVADQELKASIF
jgi:hypothetical protein